MNWIGIDYGSKLAGTTAIAYLDRNQLHLSTSTKNKDADGFILEFCKNKVPKQLFIDAPLSLPEAYFGKGNDYFYRRADKALKAMSPMFLGGLTARAMKLKEQLKALNIEVIETYPKGLTKEYPQLDVLYSKKDTSLIDLTQIITNQLPVKLHNHPTSRHEIDALLAWWSGFRYHTNTHLTFGLEGEGIIII